MTETLKWNNAALTDSLVPKKRGATEFRVPENHEELLFLAKLMEQAERYDEMVVCMRKLVKLNSELDTDERNLLSVAYKNVIGSRRAGWRIVSALEQRENDKGTPENLPMMAMLRKQLETEIAAICNDILTLLDAYLIPAAQSGEPKVFYLKMKGDYHRYYAETVSGEAQKRAALEAYDKATQMANSSLAPTHPVRLGLVLNLSVFHYEVMGQRETGFQLARQAFDEAVTELDTLDEETFRESSLIVQLLRDNLNLWNEANQE